MSVVGLVRAAAVVVDIDVAAADKWAMMQVAGIAVDDGCAGRDDQMRV